MAEKGILVEDASVGESVACRDAIQQDNDSNNRIIQLIDKAARPVVFQRTSSIRSVTSSDSFDLDPLPSGIASNLVDVSDAESCILWAVLALGTSASTSMAVHVTPVIVSEDATPVAVTLLPPIVLLPVYPAKIVNTSVSPANRLNLMSGSCLTIAQAFPTLGAKKIGFHINFAISNAATTVNLYAASSSCAGRNSAIDADVTDGVWGVSFGGF